MITQTRRVRKGLDRLNPRWDAEPGAWEVCPNCRARRPLEPTLALSA